MFQQRVEASESHNNHYKKTAKVLCFMVHASRMQVSLLFFLFFLQKFASSHLFVNMILNYIEHLNSTLSPQTRLK